ncbi:MAG: site-2 protease family protein [Pseudomonadota bacterium]|nr:site-2 protease family protein [Pseudomonadota bacterium]
MNIDLLEVVKGITLKYIPFLFALCFHEFAHAWMAKRKGDNTAELMGRLTMNPLAHMDILGTLILPILGIIYPSGIFFGWAKPVPVNERNFDKPREDMFWVALAGPLANMLLALIGTIALVGYVYLTQVQTLTAPVEMLRSFILTNLFLAFFNMLPIHPLDGGKVLARFLPNSLNHKLEESQHVSSMILIALMVTGALRFVAYPVFWTYSLMVGVFERFLI